MNFQARAAKPQSIGRENRTGRTGSERRIEFLGVGTRPFSQRFKTRVQCIFKRTER